MVVLAAIVISVLMAYRAMSVGLLPALSRWLIGIVSIAIGACLAGPLRNSISVKGESLQGCCFIVISLGAYLLMRGMVGYYMLERDVALPSLADRLGAGVCGFFGGLMLCGYLCIVVLVFPLPKIASDIEPQLRQSAQFGVAAVKLVGVFAGTDQPITLKAILSTPPSPPSSASPH
jgi:hypothetical protein